MGEPCSSKDCFHMWSYNTQQVFFSRHYLKYIISREAAYDPLVLTSIGFDELILFSCYDQNFWFVFVLAELLLLVCNTLIVWTTFCLHCSLFLLGSFKLIVFLREKKEENLYLYFVGFAIAPVTICILLPFAKKRSTGGLHTH